MNPDESVARLLDKLSLAFSANAKGGERDRYVVALLAVGNFLSDLKPPDAHNDRILFDFYGSKFAALAAAMSDLDNGVIRPVLKPSSVSNRIPDSTDVWLGRAYVAMSLDALVRAGQSRNAAAAYIEHEFPSLESLTTKKAKGLKTAALGWYSDFARRRVKNHTARKVFEEGCNTLKSYQQQNYQSDPIALARQVLLYADQIAAGLSPRLIPRSV